MKEGVRGCLCLGHDCAGGAAVQTKPGGCRAISFHAWFLLRRSDKFVRSPRLPPGGRKPASRGAERGAGPAKSASPRRRILGIRAGLLGAVGMTGATTSAPSLVAPPARAPSAHAAGHLDRGRGERVRRRRRRGDREAGRRRCRTRASGSRPEAPRGLSAPRPTGEAQSVNSSPSVSVRVCVRESECACSRGFESGRAGCARVCFLRVSCAPPLAPSR